jgi:carnitine-CoA ligase
MARIWYDPRVPAPEDCVLRPLLERRAAETPDRVFARFADEGTWTYRQTRDAARRAALGFQRLGVQHGDTVLSWLPNGPDALRVWFGLNYLGAVYVPVNLAYRGRILEHVVENADARILVAHAELVPRLASIGRAKLSDVIPLGGDPTSKLDGLCFHDANALAPDGDALPPLDRDIQPWDLQTIIYTSGTTGPSKGVMSTYAHLHAMGAASFHFIGADDRCMVNLPLFHVGGTACVYAMLVKGGSIALVDGFDTTRFWPTVRETGTTTVVLLGVMASFLVKQPPAAQDREHSLFLSGKNPSPLGTCGTPRPGVEVRIVDENDCEVAPGTVGELIVRTDAPWTMNHGYFRNPEAAARAWRNGWFHTGDAFRTDADGHYFFVDRIKDAIRRRGENVSSFEVETEVCAHPSVKEAAAVAVPSEHAEDEVLVAVSLVEGASLDPAELIHCLLPRMAHFMVPRYVRVVAELPKTPTQKVQKHLVRAEGVTADTWDRAAAGIEVKRERIGTTVRA